MILPIGQYAGVTVDGAHQVRRAAVTQRLEADEFAVWGLGHGPLDPVLAAAIPEAMPWNAAELVHYAGLAGLPAAGPILADLSGRGLLTEVEPGGEAAVAFARDHRAVPLAVGLGNQPEDPERFAIGRYDQALVEVDRLRYELWCWSEAYRSLWELCQAPAGGSTIYRDPIETLSHFLGGLHRLLAANALYLEAVAP